MKSLMILFIFIMLVSCKHYQIAEVEQFDPDFHIGNSAEQSITNGYDKISCVDFEFDNYACMRVDKVKQLNRILNRYRRVPKANQMHHTLSRVVENIEGQNSQSFEGEK